MRKFVEIWILIFLAKCTSLMQCLEEESFWEQTCPTDLNVIRCCQLLHQKYPLVEKLDDSKRNHGKCVQDLCRNLKKSNLGFGSVLVEACAQAEGYVYNGADIAYLMDFTKKANVKWETSEVLLKGLIVDANSPLEMEKRTLEYIFSFFIAYQLLGRELTRKDYPIKSNDVFDLLSCKETYEYYTFLEEYYTRMKAQFLKVKWVLFAYCKHYFPKPPVLDKHNFTILMYAVMQTEGFMDSNRIENSLFIFIHAFKGNDLHEVHMAVILQRFKNIRLYEQLPKLRNLIEPRTADHWSLWLVIHISKMNCKIYEQRVDPQCELEWIQIAYRLKAINVAPSYVTWSFMYHERLQYYVTILAKITAQIQKIVDNRRRGIQTCTDEYLKHAFLIFYIAKWEISDAASDIVELFNNTVVNKCYKFQSQENVQKVVDLYSTFEKACPPGLSTTLMCVDYMVEAWKNYLNM